MKKAKVPSSDSNGVPAILSVHGTQAVYARNAAIFAQGALSDALYYIQKGKVTLSVVSARGKSAIVAVLDPGQFVGDGCLLSEPRRMATATASSECVLTRLSRLRAMRLLQDEPRFARFFVNHLLLRNLRVEADLVDQLFNSAEKRLARILLLMAHVGKEGTPQDLVIDISQTSLAEMVGTTRSRVSAFLNKFRRLGFIQYNGGLRVHSSLLNVVLRDGEWDHVDVTIAREVPLASK